MDCLTEEYLMKLCGKHSQSVKRTEADDFSSLPFDFEHLFKLFLESIRNDLGNTMTTTKKAMKRKNIGDCLKWKEEGNKLFSLKDCAGGLYNSYLLQCLECYTKSIAHGVTGSREIAVAYANRSAVLLHLNRPKECVEDIGRALESDYPDNLKPKLLIRMAECYSKLSTESYADAKFWLSKVPDSSRQCFENVLASYTSSKKNECIVDEECLVPIITNQSKEYPCASDAVDVKFSNAMGRYVVATRDIKVGEVLVVEKPYYQYLYDENRYTHCSYCMGPALAGIPCDECVNFIYCSIECKTMAWSEYHHWECKLFDLSTQYSKRYYEQVMIIKLLIKMYCEAGGFQQLKDRVFALFGHCMEKTKWDIKKKWHQDASLESMLCLISHEKYVKESQQPVMTLSTIRILFLLLTCTEFFGVQYNREKMLDKDVLSFMLNNSDVAYFGRLLLKLTYIVQRNSYRSEELRSNDEAKKRAYVSSPFISFINHCCFPNSLMQYKRRCLAIHAIFPIKKGEQIYVTYCSPYGEMPKQERQELLRDNFFYSCDCIACHENWPVISMTNTKQVMNIEELWQQSEQKSGTAILQKVTRVLGQKHYNEREELMKNVQTILTIMSKQPRLYKAEIALMLQVIHKLYVLAGNTFPV